MNEFNSLCKAISVVSVVSGVLTALLPKSKLSNAVNALSAIIILHTFLLPFVDYESNFNISIISSASENTQYIENAASELLIDLSEKELKRKIENILSNHNLKADCKVELIYNCEELIKEKIIIENFSKNKKEQIISALETELERSVYIEFSE